MFAVKGWNVSSTLKTQTQESSNPPSNPGETAGAGHAVVSKHHKKRKRSSDESKALNVDPANLPELWGSVFEAMDGSKSPKGPKLKHGAKRRRMSRDDNEEDSELVEVQEDDNQGREDEGLPKQEGSKKGKTLKEKKREKKAALKDAREASGEKKPGLEITKSAVIAKPTPKLTPLQASMRQKLISARFRHLNEALYTKPSRHSLELFQQNPEMFHEYHEGFRRQVEVWPENPVNGYVVDITQRGRQRRDKRGLPRTESSGEVTSTQLSPLPRTDGRCTIADLGCGDAGLATQLQKDLKKLNLKIHSFDLQSPSHHVTKADIANLPLEDGSVDIAIFCLALMGTNWIDFIEEAFRILRWKGELWVAEIKSRFGRVSGKNRRVEHSVGNRKKSDKKTLKKMEEDADDADLMVEVDGHEDPKTETDVSAFVEVLQKRGFVLQNEKAIDLNNRMFVKIHFVKGLTPVKGKGVPAETGETWKKKPKAKFIDAEVAVSDEASVLKPCVYKLR